MVTPLAASTQGPIIHYRKGEQSTHSLVPTVKEPLGKGVTGTVHMLKNDPDCVVKKSISERTFKEFKIGTAVNGTPHCVSHHKLFIKHFGNGQKKYKIVMDRIYGKELKNYFYKELDPNLIATLLKEAGESCLELVHRGVCWRDLHGNNVFLTDSGHLALMDYDYWEIVKKGQNDKNASAIHLMELQRLFYNILSTGKVTDLENGKKAPLIDLGTANTGEKSKNLLQMVSIPGNEADLKKRAIQFIKTRETPAKAIEEYVQTVLARYTHSILNN